MTRSRDLRAVVFAGGGNIPDEGAAGLPPPADVDLVVVADSGLHLATALGYRVDLVVGDLDSARPDALAAAVAAGTIIVPYPAEKDATDLVLAIRHALAAGAREVVVAAGTGGRFDHVLANALTLATPEFAGLRLRAVFGCARAWVVHDSVAVAGAIGDYVTLLAVGGHAVGVVTSGLRYALCGETLEAGSSRGVSNELVSPRADVHLDRGTLLVVAPGHAGENCDNT